MKNFKQRDDKRGGFGGGRGDRGGRGDDKPVFFGKSRGGDRSTDREQRMFKAVCSDCHKSCDVPFKPSSDKPVFCRDCFSAKRDRETREYKAGLASGESKKFGSEKQVSHKGSVHTPFVASQVDEHMKKQIVEMGSRIDKLTVLVEKMIEEKKTTVTPSLVEVKSTVLKKVEEVIPKKKIASKKVVAKKVAKVIPVVAKKVAVKKVIAKKVALVKKVIATKKALLTKKTK
jgi:CxxC-x17-CxxC domain-containing protein